MFCALILTVSKRLASYNGCVIEPYTSCPGADLTNAFLEWVDLSYADLSNADISDSWLAYSDLTSADLSGATLTNADLRSDWFKNADLSGTELTNANLRSADMRNANMTNANLSGATLAGEFTYLTNADLTNANLTNADLSDATLAGTNFTNADFTNAALLGALYNIDTIFPDGFDPVAAGMRELPIPPAVYLFGTGLVGLVGIARRRKVSRAISPRTPQGEKKSGLEMKDRQDGKWRQEVRIRFSEKMS